MTEQVQIRVYIEGEDAKSMVDDIKSYVAMIRDGDEYKFKSVTIRSEHGW